LALAALSCGGAPAPPPHTPEKPAAIVAAEEVPAKLDTPPATLPLVTYSLSNGLRIIVHEDHRVPLATLLIEYDVGSYDDPPGKGGLAHLTEHLLFRGSRNVADGEFNRRLEQVGASGINGMTRGETTRYVETLPSNQLALALWLESDRLAFPFAKIDAPTFAIEKEVVKDELRDRDNRPYGGVGDIMRRALYPAGHPYHDMPTTREMLASLDAITLDDVRAFFRAHYAPNGATIVVAGDVIASEAKDAIAKYFGAIPSAATAPAKRSPLKVVPDRPILVKIEAEVSAPLLVISWPTPPLFAPAYDAELDVLATMLTKGGRQLGWKLTEGEKVATTFSAQQSSARLGSAFVMHVVLNSVTDADRALKIIDDFLDEVRSTKVGPILLEVSKSQWPIRLLFRNDPISSRGSHILMYEEAVGNPRFFPLDLARYDAVDADGIQRVARLLGRDNRLVATVLPTSGAPVGGRRASN
jgi:predicted Zn-dependent peptidase